MTSEASRGSGIHATAVIYGESGVLIIGPSGSGKSALALALLAQARSAGLFGALIGDDRVWICSAGGRLVASGAPHTAGLVERRGAGVQSAPSEPAAVIRLVVELSGPGRSWPRWPLDLDESVIAGACAPKLFLNSHAGAVDHAISVLERLDSIASDRGGCGGISLEQCAATHKNKKLAASRAGPPTPEVRGGRLMDI